LKNQIDATHSAKEPSAMPIHQDYPFFQVDRIPMDKFLIAPAWKDEKP
jgi:hypothetical protein